MKEILRAVVTGLAAQPGLLAVVFANVVAIVFFSYILHEISVATARDDALLTEVLKKCAL